MKAMFKIANPGAIECTMAITMPLSHWKNLKQQLESNTYPSWKLKSAINELVYKAEKEFESVSKADG